MLRNGCSPELSREIDLFKNLVIELTEGLTKTGYIPRRSDALALASALTTNVESALGSRTILLMGPPGTGKSAFASATAEVLNAEFLSYQFHAWTDDSELFTGVDVCAAVAGDAESVRQEGILATVARVSQDHTTVLLLDEIDKTQERTEALLLGWLQNGLVPIKPGVHLQTNLNRVITFITTNDQRELSEATKRRASRVVMNPLPVGQQEALIQTHTGMPKGFIRTLWKAARAIASAEGNNSLSIQEGIRLALAAWEHAESQTDLGILFSHWAARSERGRREIPSRDKEINAAWAELCRARKGN